MSFRNNSLMDQTVLNIIKTGVIIVNTTGVIQFINKSAEVLFGRSKKELLNHPLGIPVRSKQICEIDFLKPDLSKGTAEMHVDELTWNGKPALLIGLYDVSERKLAQKTLRASQESFSSIVENSHTGIIVIDQKGAIRFMNPTARVYLEQSIGILSELAINEPLDELYLSEIPITLSDNKQGVAELKAQQTSWQGEPAILIYIHDITSRKTWEKQLENAKTAAESADKMKLELLANFSHEYRTALHSVLSFSEFGARLSESHADKKINGYFEKIRKSGLQIEHLMGNLSDLAELLSGAVKLDSQRCDLDSVIEKCVMEVKHLQQEKAIVIKMNNQVKDSLVYCDIKRISLVLVSLLKNAIRFSPEKSVIVIKLETKNDREENRSIQTSIIDQGVGIPIEETEQIFSGFFQSSATKSGSGGLGLSLAICKETIRLHGGNIWAYKNPNGQGSIFSFTLPLPNNKD